MSDRNSMANFYSMLDSLLWDFHNRYALARKPAIDEAMGQEILKLVKPDDPNVKGLNVTQLSEKFGLSKSTISKYLKDTHGFEFPRGRSKKDHTPEDIEYKRQLAEATNRLHTEYSTFFRKHMRSWDNVVIDMINWVKDHYVAPEHPQIDQPVSMGKAVKNNEETAQIFLFRADEFPELLKSNQRLYSVWNSPEFQADFSEVASSAKWDKQKSVIKDLSRFLKDNPYITLGKFFTTYFNTFHGPQKRESKSNHPVKHLNSREAFQAFSRESEKVLSDLRKIKDPRVEKGIKAHQDRIEAAHRFDLDKDYQEAPARMATRVVTAYLRRKLP